MTACFADTSYFLALLIPRDQNHARALAWSAHDSLPLVTTDLVVVEVGNFLSPVATRRLFPVFVAALQNNRRMTVVDCSTALMQRGVEFYRARADKSWSLTDCVSFVVMHDASLNTALTADHHFEQAGFQCRLR